MAYSKQSRGVNCGVCNTCIHVDFAGISVFDRAMTYGTAGSLLCERLKSELTPAEGPLERRVRILRTIMDGTNAVMYQSILSERMHVAARREKSEDMKPLQDSQVLYCLICEKEHTECTCKGGYHEDVTLIKAFISTAHEYEQYTEPPKFLQHSQF